MNHNIYESSGHIAKSAKLWRESISLVQLVYMYLQFFKQMCRCTSIKIRCQQV